MFLAWIEAIAIWCVGLWVLVSTWVDYKRGYGKFFKVTPIIRRSDDPASFWFGVVVNVIGGSMLFALGAILLYLSNRGPN